MDSWVLPLLLGVGIAVVIGVVIMYKWPSTPLTPAKTTDSIYVYPTTTLTYPRYWPSYFSGWNYTWTPNRPHTNTHGIPSGNTHGRLY